MRGRTVTSHALVQEAVEQRATVVAEGRTGVGVDLELVLRPRVLGERRERLVTLKRYRKEKEEEENNLQRER